MSDRSDSRNTKEMDGFNLLIWVHCAPALFTFIIQLIKKEF